MNSWEKERAEQEAADQAEEERVAREDARWREIRENVEFIPDNYRVPPYLFADEPSQRRVEEEARQERPLDDTYDEWMNQNERLFQ